VEDVGEGAARHGKDDDFHRALLVAAIVLNDVPLVKHQLSHLQHSPHLLFDMTFIAEAYQEETYNP
jgi:hypothetical protein